MLSADGNPPTANAGSNAAMRTRCIWILVASLAIMVAMCLPAFLGHVYTGDDLGAYHLPTRAFYSQALQTGDSFDWMPSLYNGFYLTGEGQAGMYHPAHWLLYRWLPLNVAFCLETLLSYPFMFVGMFLFLRRVIGRADGALWGALVFTFGGFNLLHFVQTNAIAVVAHLPWMLWAIDIAICDPRNGRRLFGEVLLAFLTASQLLLGYPQYVWFTLLAEIGFVLHCRLSLCARTPSCAESLEHSDDHNHLRPRCNWQTFSKLALVKLLGLLLAGVQLLPTFDALQHSTRQTASSDFAVSGSLDPLNVVQLVAPYLFKSRVVGQNTHELGLYCGAVPILLAVFLLTNRRMWNPQGRFIRAACCFAIFALVLSLGEYGGLYRLQTLLPVVGRFRFPCRGIVLFQFAIAVLAAVGLMRLIGLPSSASDKEASSEIETGTPMKKRPFAERKTTMIHWPVLKPLLWMTGISLMVIPLATIVWPEQIAAWPVVILGPILFVSAAALIFLLARGRTWAIAPLVVLTAVDLGSYGLSYSVFPHHETLAQFITPTNPPPGKPGDRLALDLISQTESGLRIGNRITLAGWSRVDGYTGMEPARTLDYHSLDALRAAGVQYVLKSANNTNIPGLQPFNEQWLVVPNPFSRVSLLATSVTGNLLERDSNAGIVSIQADRPGRMELKVTATRPGQMSLTESWHAGWQVTINGQPAVVERINGDFLGCAVPAGASEIVFDFQPTSLTIGKIVSFCGLCLLGIIYSVRGFRRLTSKPSPWNERNLGELCAFA